MATLRQSGVRNRLLRVMASNDFERLEPHLVSVELPLESVLAAPGEAIRHLVFIESGFASITADSAQGRIEVGMVGREGLVCASPVFLGSDRSPHHHFMQLAGDGLRIVPDALLAAVEASPTLRELLLRYVQTEIVQVRETAFANGGFNIETRLARWLLMCHDRVDGDDLLLKHEFLAMMLGVQRAGVTLALQSLEGAGCIRGRRMRITVRDRERLEAVANVCYGTPEAEYARLIEGA